MPLADGCNHIALVTDDLDRFIEFYATAFDAEVQFFLVEQGMRHAMVDLGGGFHLHPFEIPDGSEGAGSDQMFGRGHLDHLAITITDPGDFALVRARLVELGATDGALVDFGSLRTVWFTDPDGMGCELAMHGSGEPRTFEDRVVEAFAAT